MFVVRVQNIFLACVVGCLSAPAWSQQAAQAQISTTPQGRSTSQKQQQLQKPATPQKQTQKQTQKAQRTQNRNQSLTQEQQQQQFQNQDQTQQQQQMSQSLAQQQRKLKQRRSFVTQRTANANVESSSQNPSNVRQFHDVLNDLLTEFSYDIKTGQINGLKNVSIRRVSVSDALPQTYEQYVELLVSERIRENARVKLINCIPCKTKSSVIQDGKVMITSPLTNVQRMNEAADQLGIENYMDVVLVYHTTHMVLAFSVFNTTTKEEVWSRTYNSETLRSRYQKLAVDMNQVEKSRDSDEYVPDYKTLIGLSVGQLPNVGGNARDKSFLGLGLRVGERFNNRKNDFGLMANFYLATSTLVKAYPTTGQSVDEDPAEDETSTELELVPYRSLVTVHAFLAQNFLKNVESYDDIRFGTHLGLGGAMASGYLAPSAKLGVDTYLGRRWVLTTSLQYLFASSILVDGEFKTARGGLGGDFALSFNF